MGIRKDENYKKSLEILDKAVEEDVDLVVQWFKDAGIDLE